jgi:tuberous sclerosis protein 2
MLIPGGGVGGSSGASASHVHPPTLGQELDEDVELVWDVLVQNSYVDCSPRVASSDWDNSTPVTNSVDGIAGERSWILGNSVITVRNVGKSSGWVEILVRRPSGVTVFSARLDNQGRASVSDENMPSRLPGPPTLSIAEDQKLSHVDETSICAVPDTNTGMSLSDVNEIASTSIKSRRLRSTSAGTIHDVLMDSTDLMMPDSRIPNTLSSLGKNNNRNRSSSLSSLSLEGAKAETGILPSLSGLPLTGHSRIAIDPSFLLLQFLPLIGTTPNKPSSHVETPILLNSDDAIQRALKVLDRTPVVDLHKIGVIYVGPGQMNEVNILGNSHGSWLYTRFLHSLGRIIALPGNEVFVVCYYHASQCALVY